MVLRSAAVRNAQESVTWRRTDGVDAEKVWARIVRLSGETFHQKGGKAFTYEARGRTIYVHTTNRMTAWHAGRQVNQASWRGPIDYQEKPLG